MLLTICLPTYNRLNACKNQINELNKQIIKNNLNQDVEILISENSNLKKEKISKIYLSGFKKIKIRILRNRGNIGYANSLNRLISKARGRYSWLLSDDDYLKHSALKKIILNLSENINADYITFRSHAFLPAQRKNFLNDIYFKDLPSAKKFTRLNSISLDGNYFLEKYWLSVIFISINIFDTKKMRNHIKFYNLKKITNKAYHNSFLCISFIKDKKVKVILDFLLIDSYVPKFYTLQTQFEMWVMSWVVLIKDLKKFNLPLRTIIAMRILAMRNLKSIFVYVISYQRLDPIKKQDLNLFNISVKKIERKLIIETCTIKMIIFLLKLQKNFYFFRKILNFIFSDQSIVKKLVNDEKILRKKLFNRMSY